jgi:pimeloyl-ACP methyl ester carboxylesterase
VDEGGTMDSKILMGLAIVLGLLALAFGGALLEKRDVPLDEDRGQLVDAGHFILEQNGARLLDESYTLFFHPVDGYMLLSQSELTIADQTVHLSQQTQYDRDFLPVFYQLAAETPSGTQIVSAQLGVSGLEMEVRVGLSRQSATLSDTTDLALLDNNLIGQYAVLLMAIRAEALDREFTAAIPQALLSLPARVEGPNAVTFRSDGVEYEGKRFDLHLGDVSIVLIERDGRLAGLINRTQHTVGYDVSLFSAGIEIDERPAEAVSGVIEREVAFASGELTLYGTLALPETGDGPHAAALFIHGSGPVDRDGNAIDPATGQTVTALDVYRQLAHALARVGIASLRFDKRGVGASDGDVTTASRTDLLDDVDAAIQALRAQSEIDAERILLIGHSEGGYLAPAAAVDDGEVAGLVLLASAARPLGDVTRWQVETLLRQQGLDGDALEAALAQQDQYTAFVKASEGEWTDYTVGELRDELPWLTDQAAAQLKSTPLSLSWLREHYLDEPADVLRDVDVPVLIINGEKDLQVPAAEAALIQELLEEAGNDDVTVHVLGDLNHLLRHHPEEPSLIYRHLSEPVDPRVIDALLQWVTARWIR